MNQLFTDPYVILAVIVTIFAVCIAILPYFISLKYQDYLRMQVKVANYKILQDTLESVSDDLDNVLNLKDELHEQQQNTIGEWLKDYYLKQQQELIANLKGIELQTADQELPQTTSLIEECLFMLNRQEFFAAVLQSYMKPESLEMEGVVETLREMFSEEQLQGAGLHLNITANEEWFRYIDRIEQMIFRICGLLIMNSFFRKRAREVHLHFEFADENVLIRFLDDDPSENAMEMELLPEESKSTILRWLETHVSSMSGTIKPFIQYDKGMKLEIWLPCTY
ncbi:hypothetical protein AB9P05_13970 [Roseivirga sp. BDSF3-8]|uniref:hypothetical protein n=1 Tax=Roseivirga sp. BDSF3-8 TaxID=3241598 RepID=UPI003532163A